MSPSARKSKLGRLTRQVVLVDPLVPELPQDLPVLCRTPVRYDLQCNWRLKCWNPAGVAHHRTYHIATTTKKQLSNRQPWSQEQIWSFPEASCGVWRQVLRPGMDPRCPAPTMDKKQTSEWHNITSTSKTFMNLRHYDILNYFWCQFKNYKLLRQHCHHHHHHHHHPHPMWTKHHTTHLGQVCEEGDALNGLPETHLVCQYAVDALVVQVGNPVHALIDFYGGSYEIL